MEKQIEAIKQKFNIIGNAPALNRAIQIAMQVAPTELAVLINGENGTGKESFSKIVHTLSHRKHRSFMAINCGSIPEGTIDSELFGHEKGAFTGALESRKGYFEAADGGTIFLDEIGEMPLNTQARLLRVLEYGEYIRVGSSKIDKLTIRVVAATNVNLLEAVQQGRFREDLYYRLNTVPIQIPPLRERGKDILVLFDKFSTDFAVKYRAQPLKLTPDAQEALLNYPFPGNIRQLKNIVEQIALLTGGGNLTSKMLNHYLPTKDNDRLPVLYKSWIKPNGAPEQDILYNMFFDFKKDLREIKHHLHELIEDKIHKPSILKAPPGDSCHHESPYDTLLGSKVACLDHRNEIALVREQEPQIRKTEISINAENLCLEDHEQELIYKSLKKNLGNRRYAAADLGISERTLYRKIKQYDIDEYQLKK